MAHQTLTLNIPDDLYNRIKSRAEASHRSIEEEAAELLGASAPEEDALPADLAELLDSMALLDDEALWRAAHNTLAREAAEEIRRLRARRESKGLSVAEQQQLGDLLRQYDRGILIRAEAAALLKQRGHEVDVLLERP